MAEKKYMIIDGIRAEFTDEKNILQVIHKVGDSCTDFLLLFGYVHLWCLPYVCGRR